MKKVLLAFFIMLLLTLTTFNAVSINDSNSQPTDTYEPIYPEPMMPGQEITELHDLSEFDSPINIDDTWLTFQNDFDDESAEFLLTFTPPTVEVGDEFLDLFVPECTYSGAGGAPILPHRTTTFTFPPGTIIDEVSFVPNYNLEQLTSIPIRPMPKPLPVMPIDEIFSEQSEQTPEMDPNIYSMDNYYPSNWFEYSTGMGLNPNTDERTLFLVVHTFPIKYNPIENNIQYLTSGTLSINVQEPIDTETQSNSRAAGNAGDGESTGTSRAEVHDMVIICPNIFKSALGDFASFKTTTGIDTKIVTMEEIISSKYFPVEGRDNAEKIKYLLYNAVITWGIKYVLLVGDAERIPTRITHVAESGLNDDEASDLYYSDVFDSSNNFCDWDYTENDRFGEYNGGNDDRLDLYPDLHVGRIPASTTGEVSSMIDKTKNYEIDTIGQPWYKNAILCGLDTFSGGTAEGEYLSDHIARNYLEDFNVIKLYESDNTLTKANIKSNWNNGAGFVSFSDHGLHSSWGGKFSSSDVSALTNNKKVSFVNFDACLTGEFDQGSSDCIAEKTILNNNGGGVAVVASSRIAYGSWGPSHINSVSGYLNVRLYHNMDHTTEIAGALINYSKIDYIRNVCTSCATNFKTLV